MSTDRPARTPRSAPLGAAYAGDGATSRRAAHEQAPVPATDREEIIARVRRLQDAAARGVGRPLDRRRRQLEGVARIIREGHAQLEQALWEDLRKSATEARITELSIVLAEVDEAVKSLASWTKPRRHGLPLTLLPASAGIVPEPLGTVLILAPWNYPVQLLLSPLVGALAAGNTVVLKPSESTPHVSAALAHLVAEHLDPDAVQLVEGAVEETQTLLAERFDHILYTGNGTVGRIVMRAAAENLTPVTLELGGKSPLWFDDDEHLDAAARRIAWAKLLNAGQTCVAPDYILTTPERVEPLAAAIGRAASALYGTAAASPDYGRIISAKHFDRLTGYLEAADTEPERAGTVLLGGDRDREDLFIAPTILAMPAPSDPSAPRTEESAPAILREEIFGPILPIVPVDDHRAAIDYVNAGDKPLALYVFSEDAQIMDDFVERTSSGGVGDRVAVLQAGAGDLPFGGVGESGMGAYHGKTSFDLFSHLKPVVAKPYRPDTLRMVQPPFTEAKQGLIRRVFGI